MPLHIDYRPQNFEEIIGNNQTIDSLNSKLKQGDFPHALLFQGPSGCGKTTFARIIKNKLNCSDRDFIEINAANNRGIDTARDILNNIQYKPIDGPVTIIMIDEVGATIKTFQEALLKPLEEAPDHVYFILCTTDPQKLLITLRNRCSIFEVKKLTDKEMSELINWVITDCGVNLPNNIIELIIEQSDGCARQALVILDQIIDLEVDQMEDVIKEIHSEEAQIKMLCQALLKNERWSEIAKIVKGLTQEPETIRRAVLGYMNVVLLNSGKEQAKIIIDAFLDPYYDSGKAGLTLSCWMSLN